MRAVVLLVAVMVMAAAAVRPGGPAVGRDRLASYSAVSLSSRTLAPRSGSQRLATLLDLPDTLTLEFDIEGGRVVLELESATSNRQHLVRTTTGETIDMVIAPFSGRVASFAGRFVSEHQFAHVSVKQIEPELVVGGYFMLNGDFYRIQPEWDEETARWVGMTVFREADWLDLPSGGDAMTSCGASAESFSAVATAKAAARSAAPSERGKRADLNGPRAIDVGIYADCNMMTLKGTPQAVADDVNAAIAWSNLRFNAVANVSLTVRSGSWVFDTTCSTGFRSACAAGTTINSRLSGFSEWRGDRYTANDPPSNEGLWIDITTCYQSGTVGLAWVGAVCIKNKMSGGDGATASGTALVSRLTSDVSFYNTFAHEVGHTFNAQHDEQTACTTGGPYIMNAVASSPPNNIQFSSCSVAVMVAELSHSHNDNTCIHPLSEATVLSISPSVIGIKTAPQFTTTTVSPAPFGGNTRIGISNDSCATVLGDVAYSAAEFTLSVAPTWPGTYRVCYSDDNGDTWFVQDPTVQVAEATGASVQAVVPDVIVAGSSTLVKFTSAPLTPTAYIALSTSGNCMPGDRLYTFQFDTTRDLDLSAVAPGVYKLCYTVNNWLDVRGQNPAVKVHVIEATATSVTSLEPSAISRAAATRNVTTTDKIYSPTSRIAFSSDGCVTTLASSSVSASLFQVTGTVAAAGEYDVCFSVDSGTTWVLQTGVTMSFANPPDAPTGITFVSSTASSITLSYQAPANVNFGPILEYLLEVTAPAPVITTTSPDLNGTVYGLLASETYTIRVYARNIAGISTPVTIQADTAAPSVPGAPRPATGSSHTSTAATARLYWSTPLETGGITLTGYHVTILTPSSQTFGTYDVQSTQVQLSGLSAGTTYTARVSAKNGVGTGPYYQFTFQTMAGSAPGKPGDLERKEASTSSIKVKWAAPETDGGWPVTSFTLYYKKESSSDEYDKVTGITELEHAVGSLDANTPYSFKVAAVNEVGEGQATTPKTFNTNANIISSAADWINANPAIFYGAIGGVCGLVILIVVIVCVADRKKKKGKVDNVEMKRRSQQPQQPRTPKGASPYNV